MAKLLEHPATLLVLILLIVLLFGWKRLPDMARSFGRSSRILKSEIDELKNESNSRIEVNKTANNSKDIKTVDSNLEENKITPIDTPKSID